MPKVVFVNPTGRQREVQVEPGTCVMQAAIDAGIDEIHGDCGGAGMCATCHIYVEPTFLDRLSPVSLDEDAMLDATAAPRLQTSRLSCQVVATDALDGLIVHLPERQA